MEQRISLITLGVNDLVRARRFYLDGLGWKASPASVDGVVTFLQMNGLALALFARSDLAKDANVADSPASGNFRGISLAYNARSREEVDDVLALARQAGGTITAPGTEKEWGGYGGYFADPDGHLWEVAWNPGFRLLENGDLQLPK